MSAGYKIEDQEALQGLLQIYIVCRILGIYYFQFKNYH